VIISGLFVFLNTQTADAVTRFEQFAITTTIA